MDCGGLDLAGAEGSVLSLRGPKMGEHLEPLRRSKEPCVHAEVVSTITTATPKRIPSWLIPCIFGTSFRESSD